MEELKEFVNSVEQELYKEKHTSVLKVEAEDNYFTLSPTMENDATLLRFETEPMLVELERKQVAYQMFLLKKYS